MLLAAWGRHMQDVVAKPLLVIVPRHPQRFDEVANLVRSAGIRVARRSSWSDEPSDEARSADAWLGDSMREMSLYYGLGDVALLGGSFAPLGGQNLIEAAACGCPVVMGPHTFNFAQAAELAQAAGAAIRVKDIDEGVGAALAVVANTPQLSEASAKAIGFATEHRGASRRMALAISELVSLSIE
jgi:3-deoxy-D-manno-octulosonic-acid transferase